MDAAEWVAYVGMGGNLPWEGLPPEETLRAATRALGELGRVEAVSSLWRTTPIGPVQEQPEFVNAAVALRTTLPPEALLARMLELERRFGRVRGALVDGPRTLDLDLLLMECAPETDAGSAEPMLREEPGLCLPHAEMHRRRFVLAPLAEIAPRARHPRLARTVQELLDALPEDSARVVRLDALGWAK